MRRAIALWLAVLLLATLAAASPVESTTTVIGPMQWTHNSVCEWPPGTYLTDYMGNCGQEIFLSWDGFPGDGSLTGQQVWVSGKLVRNGSCTILVVRQLKVCDPGPAPDVD